MQGVLGFRVQGAQESVNARTFAVSILTSVRLEQH